MEPAEPLLTAAPRSDSNAKLSPARWYDPDSVSYLDERVAERRSTAAESPAGDYSPVNRAGRFSMKAAIPSA